MRTASGASLLSGPSGIFVRRMLRRRGLCVSPLGSVRSMLVISRSMGPASTLQLRFMFGFQGPACCEQHQVWGRQSHWPLACECGRSRCRAFLCLRLVWPSSTAAVLLTWWVHAMLLSAFCNAADAAGCLTAGEKVRGSPRRGVDGSACNRGLLGMSAEPSGGLFDVVGELPALVRSSACVLSGPDEGEAKGLGTPESMGCRLSWKLSRSGGGDASEGGGLVPSTCACSVVQQ